MDASLFLPVGLHLLVHVGAVVVADAEAAPAGAGGGRKMAPDVRGQAFADIPATDRAGLGAHVFTSSGKTWRCVRSHACVCGTANSFRLTAPPSRMARTEKSSARRLAYCANA